VRGRKTIIKEMWGFLYIGMLKVAYWN
jgi:hypothetical protein